jgi:hypothetical protein
MSPEIFEVFQKLLVDNFTHNQLPIIWPAAAAANSGAGLSWHYLAAAAFQKLLHAIK